MTQPATIYLCDYRPPEYRIVRTELTFEIFEDHTMVINNMQLERTAEGPADLVLDGDALTLLCVKQNDEKLEEEAFERTQTALRIFDPGERAMLQVVTKLFPDENTELEGLYRSGGIFCTQCEPHGFRRITYFIDRPDNMSVFTVKVIAEHAKYPVLLSNGNLQEEGVFEDGRHYALWHDPFAKPSYLFALVAGDLGRISDRFVTAEENSVALNIYVDRGNEARAGHALQALKHAMRWDETVYGRSYDLSIYNIVAVDSFNMGAMENKGLNIFNSHYVLAEEATATDTDFMGIESVIAHEYFHNWTGNRITCRDWFQLTLKEGLTVFRDQSFSADMHTSVVQRIHDVKMLRERQFPEDAGPTAHPIKPDHYIEINNFYTATVYEKGAEVIRMLHTILGEVQWRHAMDRYFETFDARAVRTEDFLWAVAQHSLVDLTQFERWYSQERTPTLAAEHSFENGTLTLTLRQHIPNAVDGKAQLPYLVPLRIALLDDDGAELALHCAREDQPLLARGVLLLRGAEEVFHFTQLDAEPVLSLNRGFSAPVILDYPQENVMALMRRDTDGFNRYEAAQQFAFSTLEALIAGEAVSTAFVESFGHLLHDDTLELQFKAQLLELPSVTMLMQRQLPVDVAPVIAAHERLTRVLAETYATQLHAMYLQLHRPAHEGLDARSIGERALKNTLLGYLMVRQDAAGIALATAQYYDSLTMTDRIAALHLLENHAPDAAGPAMRHFYETYREEMLVMTKFFGVIASSWREGTLARVRNRMDDPAFDLKVPNLVRALIGSFARNPKHFHADDGSGYDFIAQLIIELDGINPMIAAGLAGAFKSYNRMNARAKAQMQRALQNVRAQRGISKNVFEIVDKVLLSS